MKVDFNTNGFSASMNEEEICSSTPKGILSTKNAPKAFVVLLGSFGLFLSTLLIPFGFLASTGAEICQSVFQFSYVNFIAAYIALLVIIIMVSMISAVLAITLCVRSKRDKIALSGLILSGVSLAVSFVGMAYNIFVLVAHFL